MRRRLMGFARVCLLVVAWVPGAGWAFHVDGFWTGMSPLQLAATASAYGLVAHPGKDGQWFVGTAASPQLPARLLGEFGFCGSYLMSYTRNVHSDADYASTLAAIFATYGPPRKMNFSGDVATGATDATTGAFRASGETEWRWGADRVRMQSYFDWRLHSGGLQREQPASVKYETLSPCSSF